MLPLYLENNNLFKTPTRSILFRLDKQQQRLQTLIHQYSARKEYPDNTHRHSKSLSDDSKIQKRARSEDVRLKTINLEVPLVEERYLSPRLPKVNKSMNEFKKIYSPNVGAGSKEKQSRCAFYNPQFPLGNKSTQKKEFLRKANTQREILSIKQVYHKKHLPIKDPPTKDLSPLPIKNPKLSIQIPNDTKPVPKHVVSERKGHIRNAVSNLQPNKQIRIKNIEFDCMDAMRGKQDDTFRRSANEAM